MAKSTKKVPAKGAAKSTKKAPAKDSSKITAAGEIARNEKSYEAFFNDLKQGGKVCSVAIITDAGSITLNNVKAYPHLTDLVNENGRDWLAGEV